MTKHVFLTNPINKIDKFKRSRYVPSKEEEQSIEVEKFINDTWKENFRRNLFEFNNKKETRALEKNIIEYKDTINYVEINFWINFSLDLKQKFYSQYGLIPIVYKNLNTKILFEIEDENIFKTFLGHVNLIISSPSGTPYKNKPYNLLANIQSFEFYDSNSRFNKNVDLSGIGIMLNLVRSNNIEKVRTQRTFILNFLNSSGNDFTDLNTDIIQLKYASKNTIQSLVNNFDIIFSVTSSRTGKVYPSSLNTKLTGYNFTLNIKDNLPIVGLIDSGISKKEPLKDVILNGIDHTQTSEFIDSLGHGTKVAGLIVLGEDFYKENKNIYEARAKIFPIKILDENESPIDIPKLINDIRFAKKEHGIRLFNLSINISNPKKYNENYSDFAYLLDKLSYDEDVLLLISVGNFDENSLQEIVKEQVNYDDIKYPDFFYKLNGNYPFHNCEDTNICAPSESLNNLSIGAMAGNLEAGLTNDFTPDILYPAHYTRKFHYDYTQIKKPKIKNNFLNKPDLVFEGGDLINYDAGINVIDQMPLEGLYYSRAFGTSLSTPLITSMASELLYEFPKIKTQTVKALLISCSNMLEYKKFPHFKDRKDKLINKLSGFGRPNKSILTEGNSKEIVFIIEEFINVGELTSIPINIPQYLKDSGNKLAIEVTLCFSFEPIKHEHLNYLPLHISFCITKDLNVNELANSNRGKYLFRDSLSWSEDHFGIDNLLLSNAQKKKYLLQPNDLQENNSILFATRCLAKKAYESQLKNKKHPFSAVIRITEIERIKNNNNLYNEMLEINNYLEIEGSNNLDLEI